MKGKVSTLNYFFIRRADKIFTGELTPSQLISGGNSSLWREQRCCSIQKCRETISCRDSLNPWEDNRESFLFLSHSPQLNNTLLTHKPHWQKEKKLEPWFRLFTYGPKHNVWQDRQVRVGVLLQSSSSSSIRDFLSFWRFMLLVILLL